MNSSWLRWLSLDRLWNRMRHIEVENKGLMLMAILLAVVLFAVSRQPISDVKLFNVPLEYRGQRQDVEISGEITQTVSVRLRGPRDLVRGLTPTQLSVVADLTNKEAGERVVQLRPGDVSLPDNGIQVIQVEPASLRLVLEPKIRKQATVEAQYSGQLADGVEFYSARIQPPVVEIEGAQSHLEKITRVLTETVSLSGRNSSFSVEVDVETPHPSLRVLTPDPVKLFVEIGERRSFKRFANVTVQWLNPSPGRTLLTKTVAVELYGPNSAVDAIQEKDLRAEITADPDSTTAVPKIILPANADPRIGIRSIIPNEVKLKK
jgi:YbbR domain-containing protein